MTDEAIRYALLEPRKQLLITADEAGANVVLMSPADGFDVDANNGPIPIACNVRQITPGNWQVAWRVRTEVIECGELSSSTSPIVSNRWSQVQSTGPDHRTSIVTRGVTVFRTDQLANVGQNADYYRGQCVPGVPLNFQRQSIQVIVNSAGNTLTWEVHDQELFVFLGATSDARRMGVVGFSGTFSTSSVPVDGGQLPSPFLLAQFDADAWGDANSTKQGLFNWLARLAIERCAIPPGRWTRARRP